MADKILMRSRNPDPSYRPKAKEITEIPKRYLTLMRFHKFDISKLRRATEVFIARGCT
jgi:hypothetical protein